LIESLERSFAMVYALPMNRAHLDFGESDPPDDPEAYEKWFREQVQAALDDPRPSIPHEQALREIAALIEERRKQREAT
jgi:hypothetical protein